MSPPNLLEHRYVIVIKFEKLHNRLPRLLIEYYSIIKSLYRVNISLHKRFDKFIAFT